MRLSDIRPPIQILLALPLLLLTGCGAGSGAGGVNYITTNPSPNDFAYAVSAVNDTIAGYSLNASTGALTQLPGFPLTTPVNLSLIATDPLGQFVVTNENPGIAVYLITHATGDLALVASVTLPVGVQSFAFNPSGTLLIAFAPINNFDPPAGNNSAPNPNPLNVFTLNRSTGALTVVPGSPFANTSRLSSGCCLAINASGTALYTIDGALLDAYSLNPTTGALTRINAVAAPAYPGSLALDPSGTFVYMTDKSTNQLHAYSINPTTGALSIGPVSTTADASIYLITLNATGTLAFTTESPSLNPSSYEIKTYSISNGKFTPTASLSSPMFVGALQLGPSGSFLYAAENNAALVGSVGSTSQIAIYSVGATGALTPVTPVPTVQWPTSFAIVSNP